MSTEELKVVLRRNENSGFGFSLLGTTGPPHVIYDIVENSPAADCGAVEAGDVILKVNGTDVHRYTTKEVLKCLRLSDDLVTLELKRDPKLKARIKEQLANTKSPHYIDIEPSNIYDYNSSGSSARRRRTTSPPITGIGGGVTNYTEDAYNTNSTAVTATTNSPVAHLRYKTSPNHHSTQATTTTLRQQTTTITTSSSSSTRVVSPTHHQQQQHSRSSSASSAKIQIFESTTIPANSNTCASPTNRPSRIPTALKCGQKPPAQQSPQHKRPRPSQIPTKGGQVGTVTPLTSPAANGDSPVSGAPLQHSNSYSGGSTCYQQQQQQQRQFKEQQQRRDSYERNSGDSEPNSAPPQPAAKAPRFEAYMMTGDLILNLSRTPQTSNLLPGHTKKVDSLRDSPIRNIATGRNAANGALAPRASGESSPTSSSSVESPSHINTATSSDAVRKAKQRTQQSSLQQQLLQQQQRDSINNSYNNSNSGGVGGGLGDERNYRKDSLTNDTLRLCEEIERDDDDDDDDDNNVDNVEDEEYEGEYELESHEDNNHRQRQRHQRHYPHYHHNQRSQPPHHHHQHHHQQQQQQHQQRQQRQPSYEIEEAPYEPDENEEDQTNYDITNIETYNSGGGYLAGPDDASDRQCLMLHCGDDDNNEDDDDADEDYSTSVASVSASASAKQRLRLLKQRAASRHKARAVGSSISGGDDAVDCTNTRAHAHHHHLHGSGGSHSGGSSSSSATVKSDGILGTNTSQDETSFSVPTSPISLSTPLIDKETANSVPTSPEPSSLGVGAVGGGGIAIHDPNGAGNVVRRHNGIVRKCDSAGFRTSKSEDHLQQIQRDGIAAVIPIDIDEDVNSSLNTLLDTRQDSEDSQTKQSTTNDDFITPSSSNSTRSSSSSSASSSLTPLNTVISKKPSTEVVFSPRGIFNKRRRRPRISIPRILLETTRNHQQQQEQQRIQSMTIINTTKTSTTTTFTTTITTATATIINACEKARTQENMIYSSRFSDTKGSNRDRIIWTYNAPLHQLQQQQQLLAQQENPFGTPAQHYVTGRTHNSSPQSHSSSISSSPQHSAGSPASPTSVSSSVMSSSGSKGAMGTGVVLSSNGGQQQALQQQNGNQNGTGTGRGAGTTATATNSMGLLQCPPINGGSSVIGTGGSGVVVGGGSSGGGGGDQSVSEAISNISSPDYQDDDNLLSSRDILGGMILSDPSDSDSTILVSDAAAIQRQQQQQTKQQQQHQQQQQQQKSEHKLVIQVRGIDSSNSNSPRSAYSELKDSEDEFVTTTTTTTTTSTDDTVIATAIPNDGINNFGRDSSPPVSDDGSDVESLHSYHYSPKAVDMPSAIRLAKRLYSLDGFKKSDVSRHLSKNNDFSRAVADEYLKYFNFEEKTLDQSLREFLQQFSLSGETQERERVLVHFSKRFLDCNPGSFNSQDAVHTLTCAIMLLNTDLHGQNIGRKMTCAEFVENLAELNDGENFPKDVLKYLYQAIKTQPLEWALDDDPADLQKQRTDNNAAGGGSTGAGSNVGIGQNPFLDLPESSTAVEYKKGYVMRKCCFDSNYKKTPFGKRSWKMFYCTLRDLVLFLHKDEHGFRKNQMSDNLHNAIRIHHALATKANDYTKKQHVFRLQTADQAEYLFQTSDSKELQSWIETINFVCAAYSAPPLEGGVGSQKRFQRPLLPSTHTKYLLKEQLESHEQQLAQLENVLTEHKKGPVPSKGLALQNYKEKENFLQYELRRYKAYVSILNAKMLADQQQQLIELQQQQQQQQLTPNNNDEQSDTFPVSAVRLPIQSQQQTNSIIAQQQQQQQPQQVQQPLQQQQQQLQQSSSDTGSYTLLSFGTIY